jgi:hypothetical protein
MGTDMGLDARKAEVRRFWEAASCGEVYAEGDTAEGKLRQNGEARYRLEPYTADGRSSRAECHQAGACDIRCAVSFGDLLLSEADQQHASLGLTLARRAWHGRSSAACRCSGCCR